MRRPPIRTVAAWGTEGTRTAKAAVCATCFAGILGRSYPDFLQKALQPGTNVRCSLGHYVVSPCIFIHIAGSTFIFNIFWGGVIPSFGCFSVEDSQEGGRVVPELHRTSSLSN